MNRTITFEKAPFSLTGRSLCVDSKAPRFTALNTGLQDITLEGYGDRVKLISFFPSIDHPICDLQVREINRKAASLPESVAVIGISRDIPFALKRFSETFDIKNIELISDQRYGSFGINYGVLIRELNLLTRGAVILDGGDVIRYWQQVKELTNQPDFDDLFENLETVIRTPEGETPPPVSLECTAGEQSTEVLSKEMITAALSQIPDWELVDGRKIVKQFSFSTFLEAKSFLDSIAVLAEEQGHHPSLLLAYNRLRVTLTTHRASGLTENDFTMARIIDQLQ
jgi:thiol peroxidase